MEFADVEQSKQLLITAISRYSTRPTELVITENVAIWADRNRILVCGNPIATSVPPVGTSPPRIVVQRKISNEEANGVLSQLDFSGLSKHRSFLGKKENFLIHLVLHELAHLENNWPQSEEEKCNHWAIARMLQNVQP